MHKYLFLLMLSALFCCSSHAVVNGTPIPDSDRRYDAVGLLLTVPPNSPCGGWISGTATLIAPATVLVAKHSVLTADFSVPPNGARTHRVRFRRAVDGGVNSHLAGNPEADCPSPHQEIYIDRFIPCPSFGVDMVLCVLESSPVGIEPVAISPSHLFTTNERIILAGWGFDGLCFGQGEHWTLRYDDGLMPAQRYPSACCIEYNQCLFISDCLIPNPLTDYVLGNLHDSGAPIFVERPSSTPGGPPELRLIAMVQNQVTAQKIDAWNLGGGQPSLADSAGGPDCVADFDQNRRVTTEDLLDYVEAFLANSLAAETDGIPGVTLSDLVGFLNHFVVGC